MKIIIICLVLMIEMYAANFSNELSSVFDSDDISNIKIKIHSIINTFPDSLKAISIGVIDKSAEYFMSNERDNAIGLLEFLAKYDPFNDIIYSVLGQFFWYTDNLDFSEKNFVKAYELNPKNVTAKQYLDILHFVPKDFEIPNLLETDNLTIRPITANDTDLDYKAVMSSIDHLQGVFGPDDNWPTDSLTYEEDLIALQKHENEYSKRTAFTYTVLNKSKNECLACLYLAPIHSDKYDVQIFMWVTKDAFLKGYDSELYTSVKAWIKEKWLFKNPIYPGRDMSWEDYTKLE
ncbi:MAG: hypothetical protein JXR48_01690 [Candidatus Delongbacteria bacterium]|nr:hypothetical protein [Candidatus Delongbacteria bacterium]MBN2833656.1 hypothetical protein [Candidatus Delongbacteria bacterium]